jgi:hypothetical protein
MSIKAETSNMKRFILFDCCHHQAGALIWIRGIKNDENETD